MKTTKKIIALTALVMFITLSLLSVKGCGDIWNGNGGPHVAIMLGSSGTNPAAPEDILPPPGVYTVQFSITGPDMDPITRTVIASGSISERFDVPVGDERTFTVTALDMDGTVLWEGETTTSVLGDPITITIDMEFSLAIDIQPPTDPTALVITSNSEGTFNLNWAPSEDDNSVAGYYVYELVDGQMLLIGSVSVTDYSETELADGTYCFNVTAIDAAGNESAMSPQACILIEDSAYSPRVPNCPEFLTYFENPGGNYNWHPNSNPPKCYADVPPPRTWWETRGSH